MNVRNSETVAAKSLPPSLRKKLKPVKTFKASELPVTSNLLDAEFRAIDPLNPFEVLPITDATIEDNTVVEIVDSKLLVVRQIAEDGEPQAVVLTPPQVLHLCRIANNVIYLPGGGPLMDPTAAELLFESKQ